MAPVSPPIKSVRPMLPAKSVSPVKAKPFPHKRQNIRFFAAVAVVGREDVAAASRI